MPMARLEVPPRVPRSFMPSVAVQRNAWMSPEAVALAPTTCPASLIARASADAPPRVPRSVIGWLGVAPGATSARGRESARGDVGSLQARAPNNALRTAWVSSVLVFMLPPSQACCQLHQGAVRRQHLAYSP